MRLDQPPKQHNINENKLGIFTHVALVQAHLFGNTSLHFRAARIKLPVFLSATRFAVCDTMNFIVIHNRHIERSKVGFNSFVVPASSSPCCSCPHAPARLYRDQHMMNTQMIPAITKTVPRRSLQGDRRSPSQYVLVRLSYTMSVRGLFFATVHTTVNKSA